MSKERYEQTTKIQHKKLSLKRFEQTIKEIEKASKWIDKLHDAGVDVINSPASSILSETIELLRILMRDKYDTINWWCFETDFGSKEYFNKITYRDGHSVNIDTVKKLYDLLLEEAKTYENQTI